MKKKCIIILIFLLFLSTACSNFDKNKSDKEIINQKKEVTSQSKIENKIEAKKLTNLKKEIPEVGTFLSNDLIKKLIDDKKIITSKEDILKSPLIDLSDQIQWQVNNLDKLNKQKKDMFFKFLSLDLKENSNSSFFLDFFIKPVYAEELDIESYSVEFDDQITFQTIDAEIRNQYSEMIEKIVFEAMAMYKEILDIPYLTDVKIILEPMNPNVDSFSYKMEGSVGDKYIDEYRIHLNLNLTTDMMLASLTKELFRGFLYDFGYTKVLNKNQQFARNAGALWAVTLFEDYPFNDYYDIYTKDLYKQNSLEINSLSEVEMKSFYQVFYFLYQEQGDLERIQNLFLRLLEDISLCEAMKNPGEESIHNIFASLAGKLFLRKENSHLDFYDNSPLARNTFVNEIINFTDPKSLDNADETKNWSEMYMTKPGFKIYQFDVESNEDGKVNMFSNINMDPTKQHTGMVVYKFIEDKWELVTVDRPSSIDFSTENTTSVTVIFFQYGPAMNHQYIWDYTDQIEGEGSLTLRYNEVNKSDLSETITDIVLTITEDIELVVADDLEGKSDYTRFVAGNIYQVNSLKMNISGSIKSKDKDLNSETVTILSGTYNYDYTMSQESFENPLIQSIDLSGETKKIENSAIDTLKDAKDSLPGMVGEDVDIDIPSIPDLDQGNDDMLSIQLPKLNRLMRIKWMPANGIFHFYNNFPPSAFSTKWVQASIQETFEDKEGKIELESWKEEQALNNKYFDVWFYNPKYDPTIETSIFDDLPKNKEAFMAEYDDIEAITKQISAINGKFDMYNLYPGINKGMQTINLSDFKKNLNGDQSQTTSLKNNKLKGNMSSRFKDNANNQYNISINFNYDF